MRTLAAAFFVAIGLAAVAHADPLPIRPRPPCTVARMQRNGARCERCDVRAAEGQRTCAELAGQGLRFRCEGYDRTAYKVYCSAATPAPRRTLEKGALITVGGLFAPLMLLAFRRRSRSS